MQYGDYWVRGYLKIAEQPQKFFYMACSNCSSGINTTDGTEYTCRECQKEVVATPRLSNIIIIFTITHDSAANNVTNRSILLL